jgi:hypothetical protein
VTTVKLFIVKKLNSVGKWDSVSLIDENGSFRGEARFESKQAADRYIKLYKYRINKHLVAEGKSKTRLKLQVFELDSKAVKEINDKKYGIGHRLNALS